MKAKKNVKVVLPQGIIRKLILHFNIDKTIIMRDTLGYNNSDFMVINFYFKILNIIFIFIFLDKTNSFRINLGKTRCEQKRRRILQSRT